MNNKLKTITLSGMIAAVYVLLTLVNPLSYGAIQIRVSAALCVLPFFDRRFKLACVLGVVIANIWSPLGIIDVAAGLVLWVIAYYVLDYIQIHRLIKTVITGILTGIIVSAELMIVYGTPFWMTALTVACGQEIALIVGYILAPIIMKAVNIPLKHRQN